LAFGIFGGTRALFCIREENLLFTSTIVYRKSLLSGKQRLIATAFKRECKERERERKSESESERKKRERERASEETVGIIILRRAISDTQQKRRCEREHVPPPLPERWR
tara:strand:- start:663 stop:989 length:327 start_codon:yes stop_codon:yes gene_type:complete